MERVNINTDCLWIKKLYSLKSSQWTATILEFWGLATQSQVPSDVGNRKLDTELLLYAKRFVIWASLENYFLAKTFNVEAFASVKS